MLIDRAYLLLSKWVIEYRFIYVEWNYFQELWRRVYINFFCIRLLWATCIKKMYKTNNTKSTLYSRNTSISFLMALLLFFLLINCIFFLYFSLLHNKLSLFDPDRPAFFVVVQLGKVKHQKLAPLLEFYLLNNRSLIITIFVC